MSRRLPIASLVAACVAATAVGLHAAEPAATAIPPNIVSLTVFPDEIAFHSAHERQQVVVTGKSADGRLHDLTGVAKFEVADSRVARVTSTGRVLPQADGTTELNVRYGPHVAKTPLRAESLGAERPIPFATQIVPVFTKLGCNSGGCHGKLSGQNGFRLSLLGFEPETDYATLVKEARGRRVFPAAPERSLLLLKASGQVAHGGGTRMDVGSDEYELLRQWIAAGVPRGGEGDPVVTRISVWPEQRTMARQSRQQLAVLAHYSDGAVEDITGRVQYDSNDPELGTVDAVGLVQTLGLNGEVAIMARYQGQVTVFRAMVPLDVKLPKYTFEPRTLVDQHTLSKWRQLGIMPSGECSDEQYIRRVSLDIGGTLPTAAQVTAFVTDRDPQKRDRLIDRLLDTPEYAYYFANKWADILKVKRGAIVQRAFGTFALHEWLRNAISTDMPYDQFTRAILVASGDEARHPPVVWYRHTQTAEQLVDDTAQVFLGQRLACANCHHHPYERWSQDDYWGLAGFFSRLGRKNVMVPGMSLVDVKLRRQSVFLGARHERDEQTHG